MALDMRFAAIGKSGQAQPETLMGIYPGGGGTQYVTSLIGRARALELILGGELADAELAERYGLVNRALPPDELDGFVTNLARRIDPDPVPHRGDQGHCGGMRLSRSPRQAFRPAC